MFGKWNCLPLAMCTPLELSGFNYSISYQMLQYILQFMIAFHSSPLCVFTSSRYERESFNSSVYTFTVSAIYCQSDVSNPTITPAEMVLLANMSNARNCIAEMYAYGPHCICLFTISTLLYHKSLLFVLNIIVKHVTVSSHILT